MTVDAEFWSTQGVARYDAIRTGFRTGMLNAEQACEYLAELFPADDGFDGGQQQAILSAFHLIHDRSDGLHITTNEYQTVLQDL